ncbi:MAG: hypothetical protein FK731_04350 [Asgard group archaeon]|nr:hypothetical protein [Asgard group archaeon]
MKVEKVFTIASIITFFALLPALIILEVRVLQSMPEIAYLFIIMDILLVGFIVLELFLFIRKWKKEKTEGSDAIETEISTEINQEWNEDITNESQKKG